MKKLSSAILASITGIILCLFAATDASAQSSTVFGPEKFVRGTGAPQTITRSFSVQDPSGEFTIVIQNGENGSNRVSSAIVELNGIQIATPDDFNKQAGQIIKSVILNQTNILSVELRGSPGSSISISIESGAPSSVFPRFTLFTNRTDPQLLRIETAAGEVIDYFGEKDDKGLATSLKVVRVQDTQGRITTFDLDEQGRPILIHSFNGTLFKITYLSNTSVIVTVISEDGLIETDVPVSLLAQTAGQPDSLSRMLGITALTDQNIKTVNSAAPRITFAQPTSTVVVKNCGVPVNNADVSMRVRTSAGVNFNLPGYLTGNGVYQVPIPTPDRSALQRQKQKCIRVAQVLGVACDAINLLGPLTQLICPAITVAVASIPFAGVAAPAIFVACEAGMAALQLYCVTLGASPGPGGPSPAEFLCDRISRAIDRASFGPVVLIPTVKIIGESPRSNLATAPPDGPFPTFTFNFPCDCQSGLGRRFLAPGGNVKIQILPFQADFTNEIRLLVRGQSRTLTTNRDVGRVIDLGTFAPGTELIFYIHVRDTGLNFFMGPASRNQDGLAHARLDCLGGGRTNAFFEDYLGGGDRDYDDAVFQIITGP